MLLINSDCDNELLPTVKENALATGADKLPDDELLAQLKSVNTSPGVRCVLIALIPARLLLLVRRVHLPLYAACSIISRSIRRCKIAFVLS